MLASVVQPESVLIIYICIGLPGGTSGKEPGLPMQEMQSPGSGRSPGGGHGSPLQDSCLENPLARGLGGLQSIGM